MKIKKIQIKNFKSIKYIEIECHKGINAFIGKNGAGKSAVFDAVNFVLGENYPMPQSFQKCWFNDSSSESSITISFWDCCSMHFSSNNGLSLNEKSKLNNEVRNRYKINYLGSDRTIKSIMPTNGWSLLGKCFYNTNFFEQETKEEFTKKMKEAMDILLKDDKFSEFQQQVNKEFCTQIDKKDIEAKFSLYDEHHFLKGLEFYNDKDVNLVNEGSGVQNSFIIACFRALATLKGTDMNPIFIDEPELYLHPHAKKSLYNVLKNLSNNAQIFYITHSSEFLSYESSNEIRRFYNDDSDGTKCKITTKTGELTESQQSIEGNKISFNNAFFADLVFLVEGYTDLLFLQCIIKTKNEGKTVEDLNISIIECGGKENISRFYAIYDALGITCFVLFDKDGKDDNDQATANLLNLVGYGFPKNLEVFLFDNDNKMQPSDKIALIKKWIKNPEKDQSKIEEIYKKFEKLLPNKDSLLVKE